MWFLVLLDFITNFVTGFIKFCKVARCLYAKKPGHY